MREGKFPTRRHDCYGVFPCATAGFPLREANYPTESHDFPWISRCAEAMIQQKKQDVYGCHLCAKETNP